MSENAKQIEYWNEVAGPKWVRLGDAMENRLDAINRLLIERAAPAPGEAVLDIGCGTGATTVPVARRVGPAGRVLGIDVSAPMLGAARARLERLDAEERGRISLLQADAQTERLPADFDLALSRFGVMFFTDPVTAFTAIRASLKPSGRLCAAVWAPLADNPHWAIPLAVAERHLGPGKPRHPRAPGPMAFADVAYMREVLAAAGFADVTITPEPVPMLNESLDEAARDACIMGPAGALLDEKSADAAARRMIEKDIRAAFAPHDIEKPLRLPATIFIVTGRRGAARNAERF